MENTWEQNYGKIRFFEPDIPLNREELLKNVLNSKVVNMIRYGIERKEDFLKEYDIPDEKKAFSLSEGAFAIEFEVGVSLGFSSDIKTSSIIMWIEKTKESKGIDLLEDDEELYPIDTKDKRYSNSYFSELIERKLVKYEIIKMETDNPKQWEQVDEEIYSKLYRMSQFWN